MTAKNVKLTLRGLQSEMNVSREELKSVKDELKITKEELKEVKQVTGRVEDNSNSNKILEKNSGSEVKCKNCDKTFNSKKELKLHSKTDHTQEIKCKLCENIF